MIDLTARRAPGSDRSIKIIGVGGAGANALDRMVLDGVNPARLIAVNTESQALTASVAGAKIQLGREVSRGLGCGGDPDLGRAAALEASDELRPALRDLDAVFLLAGLGGGTGSGATPVIAQLAGEAGALVIAVVTLPFAFEGKRRAAQAMEALAGVRELADVVICFENDRMADGVSPSAGIQQAFAAADQTISQSIQAVTALLSRRGLIHLGFDDFKAALGGANARCLFGYGEAEGDNRPYDALAKALRNPLMEKGRLLRECETVLVQVTGGPDFTLNEAQLLMEEFNRHVDDRTRLLFGAAVDPQFKGRIAVTILSSLAGEESAGLDHGSGLALHEREQPSETILAQVEETAFLPREIEADEEAEEARETAREAAVVSFSDPEPEIPAESDEPQEAFNVVRFEPEAGNGDRWEQPEPAVPSIGQPEEEEPGRDEPFEAEAQELLPAEAAPAQEPEPAVVHPVAAQTSLFDEPAGEPDSEPETARAEEAPEVQAPVPADALPPRATRPVPGRTLRPSVPSNPGIRTRPGEPRPERPAAPARPAASAPRPSAPPAPVPAPAPAPSNPQTPPAAPKMPLQETLKFEPVTRGRFEKSEPTIVDGQDLDVPTFLRRNIRIRP